MLTVFKKKKRKKMKKVVMKRRRRRKKKKRKRNPKTPNQLWSNVCIVIKSRIDHSRCQKPSMSC
jgi:hypothetical protein